MNPVHQQTGFLIGQGTIARPGQRAVALEFVTHSRFIADLMKEALRKALLFLDFNNFKGKTIVLNGEQEKALYSLLEGNDVLAVFASRFWKIHDFYDVFCCCSRTPEAVSVLISPLNSIITDQIALLCAPFLNQEGYFHFDAMFISEPVPL